MLWEPSCYSSRNPRNNNQAPQFKDFPALVPECNEIGACIIDLERFGFWFCQLFRITKDIRNDVNDNKIGIVNFAKSNMSLKVNLK